MCFNFHLLTIIRSLASRQRTVTHIVSSSIRNFSARYVLDSFCAKKFKYLSRNCWWKSSYVSTNTRFCCIFTTSRYACKHSYPSLPLCPTLFYSTINTTMYLWSPSVQWYVRIEQHYSCLKHHNFAWPVYWSYLSWTHWFCWTPSICLSIWMSNNFDNHTVLTNKNESISIQDNQYNTPFPYWSLDVILRHLSLNIRLKSFPAFKNRYNNTLLGWIIHFITCCPYQVLKKYAILQCRYSQDG